MEIFILLALAAGSAAWIWWQLRLTAWKPLYRKVKWTETVQEEPEVDRQVELDRIFQEIRSSRDQRVAHRTDLTAEEALEMIRRLYQARADERRQERIKRNEEARRVRQMRSGMYRRTTGYQRRTHYQASPPPPRANMELEKARQVLGVSKDASKQDVKRAFSNLMQRVHPDVGGSDYLTKEVLRAREIVLKSF